MPLTASPLAAALVRTSRGFASQIAVSFAAALCVAAVTGSMWRGDSQERAPATVTLDAAAVVGLLNSAFTPEGVRYRPRYPMEFETVLGPTSTASFARFASTEWSAPTGSAPNAAPPVRLASAERVVEPTVLARARAVQARMRVAPSPPVPPVRLAGLDRAVPETAAAKAATPAEAAQHTRRATILGVTLPGFVPTGEEVVGTVASVAGTVAGYLPRI